MEDPSELLRLCDRNHADVKGLLLYHSMFAGWKKWEENRYIIQVVGNTSGSRQRSL